MEVERITCPIYEECDVNEKSKEGCRDNHPTCENYLIGQEDTQVEEIRRD